MNNCLFFLSLGMFAVPPADQQGAAEAEKTLSASPMMQVEGFFTALTSSNTDGRVVVHRQGSKTPKASGSIQGGSRNDSSIKTI